MEKMVNKKIIDSEGLIECFEKHPLETYSLDDIIDIIKSYTQTIVPDVNVGDTVLKRITYLEALSNVL